MERMLRSQRELKLIATKLLEVLSGGSLSYLRDRFNALSPVEAAYVAAYMQARLPVTEAENSVLIQTLRNGLY